MEDLKDIIARNLVKCRKHLKLTQLELAEKLKYSDKNISKWERGESIPDVVILKQLADLYEVKVDDFFLEDFEMADKTTKESYKNKSRVMDKQQLLILLLSISLVWLTAIVLFSVFINIQMFSTRAWLIFIYAITASCIVSVVFTSIWCTNLLNAITVSFLIWSSGLSIFLSFNAPEIWTVFLICIPIQVLDILWFSFKKVKRKSRLLISQEELDQRNREKELRKQQKKLLKEQKKQAKQQKKLEKHNKNNAEQV